MNLKVLDELLGLNEYEGSISGLLDAPDSIGIIPAGEITTNISNLYYKRPKRKFPYKISQNKKGKKRIGYITPKFKHRVVKEILNNMNFKDVIMNIKGDNNALQA
jgi:hypothetical protein